ncbi:hypothetical protein [Actinokineospora sp.]|uniref:hypothetical protein n=1 Tax=Actinokineospora sp. TaxID=1872133 RepID=UPI003D6B46CC
MPGRTPEEAVDQFLGPLRRALKVLDGHARITLAAKGGFRKGQPYEWTLNAGQGMSLTQTGTFFASMRFEIVDSNPDEHDEGHKGKFRCSTRAYNYKLATPRGSDLWRIHWHPVGVSPAKEPHIHLPPDLGRHLPTGRITFEKAIAWMIEYDAPLRLERDAALAELAEVEAGHLLNRTWSDRPRESPQG